MHPCIEDLTNCHMLESGLFHLPVSSCGGRQQICACRDIKPKQLICLGGFRNTRQDIKYEGLKLELDETTYEWGKCYEIEVETVRVLSYCVLMQMVDCLQSYKGACNSQHGFVYVWR